MYTLSLSHLIILLIMVATLGFTIGWFVKELGKKPAQTVGTLHVETSDPDGPYLFLEFETPAQIDRVIKAPTVLLKVDTKSYVK